MRLKSFGERWPYFGKLLFANRQMWLSWPVYIGRFGSEEGNSWVITGRQISPDLQMDTGKEGRSAEMEISSTKCRKVSKRSYGGSQKESICC